MIKKANTRTESSIESKIGDKVYFALNESDNMQQNNFEKSYSQIAQVTFLK